MTKIEEEILQETKEFACANGTTYNDDIANMILNGMRENIKRLTTNVESPFKSMRYGNEGITMFVQSKESRAIELLRDLADLQNGSPLAENEDYYNKTMSEVYKFLKENESK